MGKCRLTLRFSRRTAAVIKNCACGRPIVKLDGCNKVRCYCGKTICDFCGEDVSNSGYNHFAGEGGYQHRVGGKCPLYDDNAKRNEQNAKAAEERAKKKIREENPDLSEADLEIKFKMEVESAPHGPFPGRMEYPGRHLNRFPQVPPGLLQHPRGPLHHDFPRFPENGAGLGYGPPIVGPPPVYPQHPPHGQHMIEPMYHPYNPPPPPPFPVPGPPIMGPYGERPRHAVDVPPPRIPGGNHYDHLQNADQSAAP